MNKKYTIKIILLTTMWIVIGMGTVVMLVAAIRKKDGQHCKGVYIDIRGVSNNFFVDKKDILQTISKMSGGKPDGKTIGSFDLRSLELALQKNTWIKSAQLFFDNNEMLQVKVLEREPVARVFTRSGHTFYLDTSLAMLPLSEKFSARLPVFTGFPTDKKVLLKADSNLLKDILIISKAIYADSFLMAMIDQVDITPQGSFEMLPKFGNTIIVFGDGMNTAEKFKKLEIFYKDVLVKVGWNKYSLVDVQYKNQVVARRKGAVDVAVDSLRTLQIMQAIADNATRLSADSLQAIIQDSENNTTNKNLIQSSIERDDMNTSTNTIEKPQPQGPAALAPAQPSTALPTIATPLTRSTATGVIGNETNMPASKKILMPPVKTIVDKKSTAILKKNVPTPVAKKPALKTANDY